MAVDQWTSLGALLRGHRRRVGLSQRELAERAGISVTTVRDLEQGRTRRPLPPSVRALATALGLGEEETATLRDAAVVEDTAVVVSASANDQRLLRIEVLGPLTLRRGLGEVALGRGGRRLVVARLALSAGAPVPVDELVDLLWGAKPPPNPFQLLQSYVSRLRSTLDPARSGRPADSVLTLGAGGYRLVLAEQQLDVSEFRGLVREAGRAADPRDAVDALDEALRLWRDAPLADVSELLEHPLVTALAQERVGVVLRYADLATQVGAYERSLPRLRQLAATHPLHEPLHSRLVTALADAGLQAEALAAYETIRRRLAEDLGIDPGPELAEAYGRVLRQEFSAAGPTTVSATPARGWPVPAQLPADVAGFVGRNDYLDRLTQLLDSRDGPTAVVISAIAGTAGVGKTALAVHWAHHTLGRFPDGQLYVNLRGYDPDQPVTANEVLARFLTTLGVPGPQVPADLEEREARYRTELAGRRMLIVLDNAATVDQVRPLLPGTGSSMVLVTSRDRLAGLVAVNGAHRLDLDLLPPQDAVTLLRRLIGSRADADPDAAAALAARCAYLPLALRVAAELAVARDTKPLAELVAELTDQQHRLDLLDAGGDPRAAVAAVFSWSMRHLPPAVVRAFRLMGLHPGPDVDAYAVAALTDTDLPQARRALDRLAQAHLVHPTSAGRYGMHDLLRAYASSLTAAEDPESERKAASTRLFDYYLATAASAVVLLSPIDEDTSGRSDIPMRATPTPDFGDPEAARRWLDTERSCLVATAGHTATHGWPAHTVRLSRILYRYLVDGDPGIDALTIHQHAHDAALQTADLAGQAHALLGLSSTNLCLDRLEAAAEAFLRALTLYRQIDDPIGEARVLTNLGSLNERRGLYQVAEEQYQQALALYRQAGHRRGEVLCFKGLALIEERTGRHQSATGRLARVVVLSRQLGDAHGEALALIDLGIAAQRQGRYLAATDYHQQALALFTQADNRLGQGMALTNLGLAVHGQGRYLAAADHYQRALALFTQLGAQRGEAWALDGLGSVHTQLDQPGQASALHEQALALFKKCGDRLGEARALNGLGEAALAAGNPTDALSHHTTALATSTVPEQQARAHTGIGHAYHALGDTADARQHYERALTLYIDLGSPDADGVHARLAALGDCTRPA